MFSRSYNGGYIRDLTLALADGETTAAYICQACRTLTTDPFGHEMWHEGCPT